MKTCALGVPTHKLKDTRLDPRTSTLIVSQLSQSVNMWYNERVDKVKQHKKMSRATTKDKDLTTRVKPLTYKQQARKDRREWSRIKREYYGQEE